MEPLHYFAAGVYTQSLRLEMPSRLCPVEPTCQLHRILAGRKIPALFPSISDPFKRNRDAGGPPNAYQ